MLKKDFPDSLHVQGDEFFDLHFLMLWEFKVCGGSFMRLRRRVSAVISKCVSICACSNVGVFPLPLPSRKVMCQYFDLNEDSFFYPYFGKSSWETNV